MAKRLLIRDQQGERERLLVGTMTVGRDTRCDISDGDPLLSRRHAEFVCRPESLVVRDLNSRNGVAVNGVRVQEAVLRPGDVVKVARLVMTYLGDHDSARPPSESGPSIVPPRGRTYDERAGDTARLPAGAPAGSPTGEPAPDDDRTRVVGRRGDQRTGSPAQVAVARLTPSTPREPWPEPESGVAQANSEDPDRTSPVVRPPEFGADSPVLPRSATSASTPVPAVPPRDWLRAPTAPSAVPIPGIAPPSVVAPESAFDDLSLELRPAAAPAAPVQSGARPQRVSVRGAMVGLALLVFVVTAAPMVVWITYQRDAPPVLWNFIVVLGPTLLGSLAAGLGMAQWLGRRSRND